MQCGVLNVIGEVKDLSIGNSLGCLLVTEIVAVSLKA